MNKRYHFRLFRLYIVLLLSCILLFWLIPSIILYIDKKNLDRIDYYDDILFKDIYPSPPSSISNWTINDYFIRKQYFNTIQQKYTINNRQKVYLGNNIPSEKKQNYLIVEYTTVFNRPKFCGKTDEVIFGKQCPYKNCRYTCDRNLSKSANILLMHGTDINFDKLPKKRNLDQIWLYWNDEPCGIKKGATYIKFNWTISYRFDSEVNIGAYGLTILRDKPLSLDEYYTYINEQYQNRQSYAIWFVSNCQPKARLNYYKQLQHYYPFIKVHGHCIAQNQTNKCHRNSQCEYKELTNNKYYLSFESQSCQDYITEKFWRSLSYGIIPIVFGPKNKQSIERIAPPHSFIYTGDYQSAEKLATHLYAINQNRTLFSKYHQWRRYYRTLYQPKDIEYYRFCEICYRLNRNDKRMYYENLNEFFLEDC